MKVQGSIAKLLNPSMIETGFTRINDWEVNLSTNKLV